MTTRATAPLLAFILLAGCFAMEPAPAEHVPDVEPAAAMLIEVDSSGCTGTVLLYSMPLAEAQAFLPSGWRAASFLADGVGHAVIQIVDCEEGLQWSAADLSVLVEPPNLPDQVERFDAANRTRPDAAALTLNAYLLASHTNHPDLVSALETASVTQAAGRVEPSQTTQGPFVLASGAVRDAAGPVLEYQVSATPIGQSQAHVRMWAQAQDGVLLVERLLHGANDGSYALAQGVGHCTIDPRSVFGPLVGDRPCDIGEAAQDGISMRGRGYFFPGIAADEGDGLARTIPRERDFTAVTTGIR